MCKQFLRKKKDGILQELEHTFSLAWLKYIGHATIPVGTVFESK